MDGKKAGRRSRAVAARKPGESRKPWQGRLRADADAVTAEFVASLDVDRALWRYDVAVRSAGGDTPSGTYSFTCHRKADRRGFIRRSRYDGRYFEFDDGSFYYPLGQNVCWASNYDHFLEKIQE